MSTITKQFRQHLKKRNIHLGDISALKNELQRDANETVNDYYNNSYQFDESFEGTYDAWLEKVIGHLLSKTV